MTKSKRSLDRSIHVRLSVAEYEQLEAIAATTDDRTVGWVARNAIVEYLERQEVAA